MDDNVVDAIDKPLRRIINRAYDGPRPAEPASPQPLNNIRVNPSENRSALNGIRSSLNQVRSNLRQLGTIAPCRGSSYSRRRNNIRPRPMSRTATGMTNARKPTPRPESTAVESVEPADWVKPVELIELLQRRAAKGRRSASSS